MSVVAAARAVVPATCGEVVQGVDPCGPLLVSLPVEVCGSVSVSLTSSPGVAVTPPLPRATAALRLALDVLGWRGGAVARLGGEVPQGRGMGSSTVDVAGVLGAAFAAAGRPLPPGLLLSLMTAVEPSDSSPLPGLWAVDHVGGTRLVDLGPAPAWHLVAVDSGAAVDTLAAHRAYGAGPRIPAEVLGRLRCGELARLATESARRNQERLPHPAFRVMERVVAATGALGICVAHSGSICAAICADAEGAARTGPALRSHGLPCVVWRAAAPGMRVTLSRRLGGLLPQRPVS
jgi:L-threonine kinase